MRLPAVDILFPDRETTGVYARLITQLRREGSPIPTNDLWIASLAVQHGCMVYSRDKHFHKIPQLGLA